MNRWTHWTRYLMLVFAAVSTFVLLSPDAEARRMGGGRSIGKSTEGLFKRSPAQSTPQRANATDKGQSAAAAGSRGGFMGPIAGLAAGLGLAALASYLGFGEELANLMMILLLVLGGVFLLRFIMRRMGAPGGRGAAGSLAPAGNSGAPGLNGAAGGNVARDHFARDNPAGNAAGSSSFAARPAAPASADTDHDNGLPADFDAEAFVRQAKVQFVRLQAVYDAGNLNDLAEFTTPEMFAELKLEINERGAAANQTDVVTLDGELLGVDDSGPEYIASVQFHGMIREDPAVAAKPFDETWTMTKPRDGSSGWVLAGIQQNDG